MKRSLLIDWLIFIFLFTVPCYAGPRLYVGGSDAGGSATTASPVEPSRGGTGISNDDDSTITITGAYGLTLNLSADTSLSLPTSGTLATTTQIPTASSLHLDDLLTCTGVASEATHLGTFTGSTISDSQTVKQALQELETAVEAASIPDIDTLGDASADGTIALTGYKLTLSSTLNSAGANLTMTNTTADLTADTSFIDMKLTDDGDANGYFLRGYDHSAADLKFSIGQDGNISTTGTITSTAATSAITMSAAEATITHSGATSLTVASTTGGLALNAGGTVTIKANGEDIVLTGGSNSVALSSTTSNALIDTGTIGLNLEDAKLEIPNSDDPDVSVLGQISLDTDGWLRVYHDTSQKAIPLAEQIVVTVIKPNDLADAQRDAFPIWTNTSGMSFIVTGWQATSDTDNTDLNIEETDNAGGNNTTVDAVSITENGTGLYYKYDSTITAGTIENYHMLWLDFDDTDTPGVVHITIYGYYAGDVN